jgi:hypothetical protein
VGIYRHSTFRFSGWRKNSHHEKTWQIDLFFGSKTGLLVENKHDIIGPLRCARPKLINGQKLSGGISGMISALSGVMAI